MSLLSGPLIGFASRLKFPTLFFITLALWLLTLAIPDPIPFIDEILMGLGSLLLASWKRRKAEPTAQHAKGATIEGESRRL